MQQIKNKGYEGERPLFARHDLQLDNVTIHTRESALKECSNIIAVNCRFEGKYPFWAYQWLCSKELLFHRRRPCRTMVLPQPAHDGHRSGSTEDVP